MLKFFTDEATLHHCIEFCAFPLEDVALRGIKLNTEDNVNMQFPFMLTSYVPDLPEVEYLLSVKRG